MKMISAYSDAFEKYGKIVTKTGKKPTTDNEYIRHFVNLDILELDGANLTSSIFKNIKKEIVIERFEMHEHSDELIVIVSGECVLGFCKDCCGKPDETSIEIFKFSEGDTFKINKKIWHTREFSISNEVKGLCFFKENTEIYDLEQRIISNKIKVEE